MDIGLLQTLHILFSLTWIYLQLDCYSNDNSQAMNTHNKYDSKNGRNSVYHE
jgi:hypothetical protein